MYIHLFMYPASLMNLIFANVFWPTGRGSSVGKKFSPWSYHRFCETLSHFSWHWMQKPVPAEMAYTDLLELPAVFSPTNKIYFILCSKDTYLMLLSLSSNMFANCKQTCRTSLCLWSVVQYSWVERKSLLPFSNVSSNCKQTCRTSLCSVVFLSREEEPAAPPLSKATFILGTSAKNDICYLILTFWNGVRLLYCESLKWIVTKIKEGNFSRGKK